MVLGWQVLKWTRRRKLKKGNLAFTILPNPWLSLRVGEGIFCQLPSCRAGGREWTGGSLWEQRALCWPTAILDPPINILWLTLSLAPNWSQSPWGTSWRRTLRAVPLWLLEGWSSSRFTLCRLSGWDECPVEGKGSVRVREGGALHAAHLRAEARARQKPGERAFKIRCV